MTITDHAFPIVYSFYYDTPHAYDSEKHVIRERVIYFIGEIY